MGSEVSGNFSVNGKSVRGKVRLETDVLQLRGDAVRLLVSFKMMRNVRSADGVLRFESLQGCVALELGAAVLKWADKILHPPSRLAKIGVKPDWRVAVLGIED